MHISIFNEHISNHQDCSKGIYDRQRDGGTVSTADKYPQIQRVGVHWRSTDKENVSGVQLLHNYSTTIKWIMIRSSSMGKT